MYLTYRYRLKDAGASRRRELRAQARSVNFVWNYCCQIDREAQKQYRAGRNLKRPSGYDLQKLTAGMSRELGIHSDSINAICAHFARARDKSFPRTPRFRSYKRNLDWIPFNHFDHRGVAKLNGNTLVLLKRSYPLWLSRSIPEGVRKGAWSFSTDSRKRWYVNILVERPVSESRAGLSVGIDLGLKSLAALSTGEKIEAPQFYRRSETKLANLQRQKQTRRARALSAKIANQRKHFLHVATADIVRRYAEIYVGDVSPSKLQRTKFAKSANDASWTMLRNFLQYKSIATGGRCEIVNERWTSQTCSRCGVIPASSPKGMGALGVRHWECSECGARLDRDVNAAMNILRAGVECHPQTDGISK